MKQQFIKMGLAFLMFILKEILIPIMAEKLTIESQLTIKEQLDKINTIVKEGFKNE